MQVTSLLSRTEHEHHEHTSDAQCASCGHEHEHTPLRLKQTVTGLVFLLNSVIVNLVIDQSSLVADASAMIGAILLGYPIVWTAITDLRRGVLSTNELVALAVIASFGSGHY